MKRFVGALLLSLVACGRPGSPGNRSNDIVGGGVAKELIRNVGWNAEFEKTLESFGFQAKKTCIQEIRETYPDGRKEVHTRIFGFRCESYPIPGKPVAEFRIFESVLTSGLKLVGIGAQVVAELDKDGKLRDLCFNKYSQSCDFQMRPEDGSLEGIVLKSAPGGAAVPEGSALAKAVVYLANTLSYDQFVELGIEPNVAESLVVDQVSASKPKTLAELRARHGDGDAIIRRIAPYAQAAGYETLAEDMTTDAFPVAFNNGCNRPLRVTFRVRRDDLSWLQTGWYSFDASEWSRSMTVNGSLLKSRFKTIYYYAETTDGGAKTTWHGEFPFSVDGISYKHRLWRNEPRSNFFGNTFFYVSLGCSTPQ